MIGEQVGDYKVVTKLGSGGMGVVYGAEHVLLGQPAALKILHRSLSADHEMVERFFNEAKAASAIRHPGIVEVYTFGYHTDGTAYLAMAFLEGMSLEFRARRIKVFPDQQALRIASQIAGALGAAHDKQIVHRDLKPDNVYLVPDADMPGGERIKLLDFGIAKLAGDEATQKYQTKTGAVFGTPAYMSPEQCRGAAAVDHRSDLYALGCILYRMVCGRLPFDSPDGASGDVIAAQLRDPPVPPRTIRPEISQEVESIILKLMEKDPGNRFQSARELRGAISAILGESTGQTVAISESAVASDDSSDKVGTATTLRGIASQKHEIEQTERVRSRAALYAVVGFVAVAAAGTSIFLAVSGDDHKTHANTDVADAAPVTAARVDATEAECRAALARAAQLLDNKLPREAIPYVYMREFAAGGERAEELVQECVQGFDGRSARCIGGASSALDVSRCADDMFARDCGRGDTEACGVQAGIAYERGKYDESFELATKACEEGSPDGCGLLGLLHFYGRGAEQSYQQAFRMFARAGGLDDADGLDAAASMLLRGIGVDKDEGAAVEMFERACRIDTTGTGCVSLGEQIWKDESRRDEARELFDRTCRAGRARGCVLLADLAGGDGAKLYARARELYEPRAEHAPYSARRLGELLRDGKGGEADPGAARKLFDLACESHEPLACEALGDLDVSGAVKLNLATSLRAYERACGAGISRACGRAECQRLAKEGRAEDAAWRKNLASCRKTGALGPGYRKVRKTGSKVRPRKKPKHSPLGNDLKELNGL